MVSFARNNVTQIKVDHMPNSELETYIQNQRRNWNSVAAAWERWDQWLHKTMLVYDELLVDRSGVKKGGRVLDLGSGTGYPAIRAAQVTGPDGEVVGLDIAEKMLDVARRKADSLGLGHITFQRCDVGSLPFDDASFDSVTSRFCLMFLPDPATTLREISRVISPGGGFASSVWGAPEKNPSFTASAGVLKEFSDAPPPDPKAPGMFRMGQPGELAAMLEQSGFTNVREEEVTVQWCFASSDEYISNLKEMAAPFKVMLDKLSAEDLARAEEKIKHALRRFEGDDGRINLDATSLVVSGVKGHA